MANFIVDIGNTSVKASWAEGLTLGKSFRYQGERVCDFIVSVLEGTVPDVLLVSSPYVISSDDRERYAGLCRRLLILDPHHAGLSEKYSVPPYLTYDRAASVIACRHLFRGRSCIVFDMGTTFTVDVIGADGSYRGGNISLGCRTRLRALNRYSRFLPLLDISAETSLLGTSAESSVISGVMTGIMFEMEGYLEKYPSDITVITGGESIYFEKRMKKSIFVICNLVFKGLALIADGYVEESL